MLPHRIISVKEDVDESMNEITSLVSEKNISKKEDNGKSMNDLLVKMENILISDDPGTWPDHLNNKSIEILIMHHPVQVKNYNFPLDEMNRKFSEIYYYRNMSNSEKVIRPWLLYSIINNSVYCLYCKIFNKKQSNQFITGCNDWQHLSFLLSKHELSHNHLTCCQEWSKLTLSLKKGTTIDCIQQRIYELEKKRWYAVLERIIYIIQFLSQQSLAFRESSNLLYHHNNGNFLKLTEMISKFDNVMLEHLRRVEKSQNRHSKQAHYLGDKIQNELIALIAENIKSKIIDMLKESKYYSIILDCTPDVSHSEQLTIVVRFVKKNEAVICEHFLGFVPINDSTGKGLSDCLLNILAELKLNINDLRGQGYDNGANMRGKHNGVQKKILQINPRAFFVPCSAHSLNLVVNDAAKMSFEIIDFFNIVQELYVYFSVSTKRWNILKKNISNLTLKPLSNSRWESRIESIKPLKYQLGEIYDSLIQINEDETDDMNTRLLAQSLCKKIQSFKFICATIIWYKILSKINVVSKMFQDPKLNIGIALEMIENLKEYFTKKRSNEHFLDIISKSKKLSLNVNGDTTFPIEQRLRKRKKHFDYETEDEPIIDPQNSFKCNFYYIILDSTLSSLNERFELLRSNSDIFLIFYSIKNLIQMSDKELLKHCNDLQIHLTDNVLNESDISGPELYEEIISLRIHLKLDYNSHDVLNYIHTNGLSSFFPNMCIALRIYLTMPVSVATGERSFSKLKIVKNYLRSTMNQDRLTNLSIISIEHQLCQSVDTKSLIEKFSAVKARKVHFV